MKAKSIIKTTFTVFNQHYDNKKCCITTKSQNVKKNLNQKNSLWFYFSISTGSDKREFVNGHFNIEINDDETLTVNHYLPSLYSIGMGTKLINPKSQFTCFSTNVKFTDLRDMLRNIFNNFDYIIENAIETELNYMRNETVMVQDGFIRRKVANNLYQFRYANNIMIVLHDVHSNSFGDSYWYNMYHEDYHNLIESGFCKDFGFIKKLKYANIGL